MFTPQEVSDKVFPKASFGGGGYSMSAVPNEFSFDLGELKFGRNYKGKE